MAQRKFGDSCFYDIPEEETFEDEEEGSYVETSTLSVSELAKRLTWWRKRWHTQKQNDLQERRKSIMAAVNPASVEFKEEDTSVSQQDQSSPNQKQVS